MRALAPEAAQNSVPYGGCSVELMSTKAVSAGVGAHWVGVPEAKGPLPCLADMQETPTAKKNVRNAQFFLKDVGRHHSFS